MGSAGKARWKVGGIFSRHSRSPSSSSSSTATTNTTRSDPSSAPHFGQQPPPEFLCPVSGRLMADPVVIPTGQTFERACIQACLDLGVDPPGRDRDGHGRLSPATPLVPNLALRSSILSWCHSRGLPPPSPVGSDSAADLVRYFHKTIPVEGPDGEEDQFFDICNPTTPGLPHPVAVPSSEAVSSSSGEMMMSMSPLEDQIVSKLKSPRLSDQEQGLLLLRRETRDSVPNRATLCTTGVLTSLRPFLLSRNPSFQSDATASLVNLSLLPVNKTPIIRSGAIPPLVSALKSPHQETRSHAAAALFSLSLDESNKAAIGALGSLPPLLCLLSRPDEEPQARQDAVLALYHLSTTGCSVNRSKLARIGAARVLLAVVAEQESGLLGGMALSVVGNLAKCADGRAALMDAGAVEAALGMTRKLNSAKNRLDPAVRCRREQCVGVLHGMSKGSLRFRGLAKDAGGEEALAGVATAAAEELDGRVRDMASRIVAAMRGQDGFVGGASVLADGNEDDGRDDGEDAVSCASDPVVSTRRRPRIGGRLLVPVVGVNSSEF